MEVNIKAHYFAYFNYNNTLGQAKINFTKNICLNQFNFNTAAHKNSVSCYHLLSQDQF